MYPCLARLVLVALCCLCGGIFPASAEWPEKPVTLIVGWPPGSGSDLVGRELASGLARQLGVSVNVLNLEGGSGIFAHSAVAYANPDGYTLGLVTPEILGAYWTRQAEYGMEQFTPLVMVEESPAIVWVARDSPWRDMRQVVAALRRSPAGTYRAGGVAEGGAYHIAMADFLRVEGLSSGTFQMAPGDGGASCLEALANRQIDVCVDSLREGGLALQQGRVRALAVFARESQPGLRHVPTMREALGHEVVGGVWRVLMAPRGLPPEIRVRLQDAAREVVASVPFNQFETIHDLGVPRPLAGQDLGDYLVAEQLRWGGVLRDLGLRRRQ